MYNKRFERALEYAAYTGTGGTVYLYKRCYDYHLGGGLNITLGGFTCSSSVTSPGNNSNAYQIVNKVDDTRTQNFVYDSLNRVNQAYTNGANWGQQFTIDAWSNLTAVGALTGKAPVGVFTSSATTKNQLSSNSYDAAGNALSIGNGAITYDAENRISTAAGVTYTYDGDGKRVEKSNGTLYWTGVGSDVLDESNLTGTINEEYVIFNGMRVSKVDRPSGTVHAFLMDHLGSSRMMVTPSGTNTLHVDQDLDYTPYGILAIGTAGDHYEFTGKERDSESGLDNFGARYNASTMGRFMTPDPSTNLVLRAINPQRWNMYAYAINNPISYVDHDGRDAAAVNFSGMVGGLGHEGLLVINKDGTATYARFGPEDHSLGNVGGASGPGVVSTYNNIPTVQFGSNGLPTDASVQAVAAAVAQDEGVDPSTVRINYFQTGSTDTAVLNEWVQLQQEHSQNGRGQYGHYCVTSNNCATFTATGLVAGGAITAEQARGLSIDPNRMFNQLSRLANDNFDLLQMQIKPPEKACVTTYGPNGPDTHCE